MIYDIYGTVVNQLITGKPTAQAGLSMAKLHAVSVAFRTRRALSMASMVGPVLLQPGSTRIYH